MPDSGTGLEQWWAAHGADDGSWVAQTYRELIERAGPTAERHVTTHSFSLDMKAAARAIRSAGHGMRGAAAVLRAEMRTLTTALRAADLTPGGWYGPGELAVMLRSAYDPAVAPTLERSELGREPGDRGTGRRRGDLGAAALGLGVPCGAVCQRVAPLPGLSRLPRPSAPVLGGTPSVHAAVRTGARRCGGPGHSQKKTGYLSDATQRAKIGQIEDAEYRDVLQQEADLIAGHGVLRYIGLIAVSAPSVDELDAAVAAVEQAAIQASCETRRLFGQQAQAFTAAALPLCRGL